jgi:hypothetical protein
MPARVMQRGVVRIGTRCTTLSKLLPHTLLSQLKGTQSI